MEYQLDMRRAKRAVAALDERRRLFDNLPTDPQHTEWLRHRAWVRTIHGSTRIEGNTLSDIEVDELLAGASGAGLPRKDALEVIGTREALALVDEIAPVHSISTSEAVIREIHRRVLQGQISLSTPGEYRRGENRVVQDGATVFMTPPSGDVADLMRGFGRWLGGPAAKMPAPIAAALAHLELVAIHPFNDGNGRTARALGRLLLIRGGYALNGLVSLDAYLDQNRSAYFAAITAAIGQAYSPPYDATPFVAFFIESITKAADHVIGRLREVGEAMVIVRQSIADGTLPPPMINGLAFAVINRSIRPADYIRITGRHPNTTTKDLRIAEREGFLVSTGGQTRKRVFLLGPRLVVNVQRPT